MWWGRPAIEQVRSLGPEEAVGINRRFTARDGCQPRLADWQSPTIPRGAGPRAVFQDAGHPRLQTGAELESTHPLDHLDPGLLGHILGSRLIRHISQRQPHEHRVMLFDQPRERSFVPLPKRGDHLLFPWVDLEAQRRDIIEAPVGALTSTAV